MTDVAHCLGIVKVCFLAITDAELRSALSLVSILCSVLLLLLRARSAKKRLRRSDMFGPQWVLIGVFTLCSPFLSFWWEVSRRFFIFNTGSGRLHECDKKIDRELEYTRDTQSTRAVLCHLPFGPAHEGRRSRSRA